jgi:hypothetical protein
MKKDKTKYNIWISHWNEYEDDGPVRCEAVH